MSPTSIATLHPGLAAWALPPQAALGARRGDYEVVPATEVSENEHMGASIVMGYPHSWTVFVLANGMKVDDLFGAPL